jgi:hypothetical protein
MEQMHKQQGLQISIPFIKSFEKVEDFVEAMKNNCFYDKDERTKEVLLKDIYKLYKEKPQTIAKAVDKIKE